MTDVLSNVWRPYSYSPEELDVVPQRLYSLNLLRPPMPTNFWCSHPKYDSVSNERMQKLLPGYQGLVNASMGEWLDSLLRCSESLPKGFLEIGGGYGCHVIELLMSDSYPSRLPQDGKKNVVDIIDAYPAKLSPAAREDYMLTMKHNLMLTKKSMSDLMVHFVSDYLNFIDNKIQCKSKGIIFINGIANEQLMVNVLGSCWVKLAHKGVMVISCADKDTRQAASNASRTFLRMLRMYPDVIERYGKVDTSNGGCINYIWKS